MATSWNFEVVNRGVNRSRKLPWLWPWPPSLRFLLFLSQDPGSGKKKYKRGWLSLIFFMVSFLYSACSLPLSTKWCFKMVEESKLLGVWTVGFSGTQTFPEMIILREFTSHRKGRNWSCMKDESNTSMRRKIISYTAIVLIHVRKC